MGSNTVWIIIGVVAIVAVGAWYFMSGDPGTVPATDPAAIEAPAENAPAVEPAAPEAPAEGGTTGN